MDASCGNIFKGTEVTYVIRLLVSNETSNLVHSALRVCVRDAFVNHTILSFRRILCTFQHKTRITCLHFLTVRTSNSCLYQTSLMEISIAFFSVFIARSREVRSDYKTLSLGGLPHVDAIPIYQSLNVVLLLYYSPLCLFPSPSLSTIRVR